MYVSYIKKIKYNYSILYYNPSSVDTRDNKSLICTC